MKNLFAITVLLFVVAAQAQYKNAATGEFNVPLPNPLLTPQGYKSPPSQSDYEAAGYEPLSSQDYADMAEAAAIAKSNAQAQASLPAVFGNGIATIDAEGHHIKHVAIGDAIVPIAISQSPLDPATAARLEAEGVAKWKEKQAAKESAMQEAVAITAEVAKKEASAKLEAEAAAAGGKELTDKQEHDIMWKYFTAEKQTEGNK